MSDNKTATLTNLIAKTTEVNNQVKIHVINDSYIEFPFTKYLKIDIYGIEKNRFVLSKVKDNLQVFCKTTGTTIVIKSFFQFLLSKYTPNELQESIWNKEGFMSINIFSAMKRV